MQRLAVTLLPIVIVFQLTAGAVLPVQLPSSPVAGKLLQALSVEPGPHRQLPPPPKYMVDLYKSVADDAGLIKAPNPYDANVIRSFTEKGQIDGDHFFFNVSGLTQEESVLEAELHVYITADAASKAHLIRVYQTTEAEASQPAHSLLDVKRWSGRRAGWYVFRVGPAVRQWLSGQSPNLGLTVVASSASGRAASTNILRFGSNRPVLVLFDDDGVTRDEQDDPVREESRRRHRRSVATYDAARNRTAPADCHRRELYVDFESIGWSEWIIAPKGYNAYHCTGVCSFPLGQSQKPTNHATVQSIIHEMQLADGVARPCCVPSRLLALSLLYYDENDNVVLKQYGDMVAESCGCQ